MVVLFNNCHNRKHAEIYGTPEAFFDLGRKGTQGGQAKNLARGQQCIVASYSDDGGVQFDWHILDREEILPGDGEDYRVFLGTHKRREKMPKDDAVKHEIYRAFFDANGSFHRTSVILDRHH